MIQLNAELYCDRCHEKILDMNDVEDREEGYRRLSEFGWPGAEDEDGNDVCAACWRKWDAAHPVESSQSVGAVDPVDEKVTDGPRA